MDLIYFLIDFILHIDVHLAELVAEYGVWVYAILFFDSVLRNGAGGNAIPALVIRCCLLLVHWRRWKLTISMSI